MQTSDALNEIATALAKAQAEMTAAPKDANNKHFGSSYASLQSVVEAVREPLAKNGIAFLQGVENADDAVSVTTRLIHTSGQWVETTFAVKPSKADAQGCGSAATYLRRYALMGITGIAPGDDDDGNAAAGLPNGNGAQKAASTRQPAPPPSEIKVQAPNKPGSIQVSGQAQWNEEQWRAWSGALKAKYEAAKSEDELNAWVDENRKHLDALTRFNPAWASRLQEIEVDRRTQFTPFGAG